MDVVCKFSCINSNPSGSENLGSSHKIVKSRFMAPVDQVESLRLVSFTREFKDRDRSLELEKGGSRRLKPHP